MIRRGETCSGSWRGGFFEVFRGPVQKSSVLFLRSSELAISQVRMLPKACLNIFLSPVPTEETHQFCECLMESQMPDRNPDEIRSDIDRTREEIAQSIVSLRDSVSEAADWKLWVRRNPVPYVASAFALGFWVGWR